MSAEGLEADPGVSQCSFSGPAGEPVAPTLAEPQPAQDEVIVKKRTLKRVKHQVSALIDGEDLPEGAQAREIAEVPYQIPAISREAKVCPLCHMTLKTDHRLMVHMGVHGVRNSPVTSVGRFWPLGKCSGYTQRLVCKVGRLHALTVVRSMPVGKV